MTFVIAPSIPGGLRGRRKGRSGASSALGQRRLVFEQLSIVRGSALECGIDMVMELPPSDFCPRFAQQAIRWAPSAKDCARFSPWLEARALRSLVALWKTEKPDLSQCFPLKHTVYNALAAGGAMVRASIDAVPRQGHVSRSGRSKACMLPPGQKACDVYTVQVRWPAQNVVALK